MCVRLCTGAIDLVRACRAAGLKTAVGSSAELVKVSTGCMLSAGGTGDTYRGIPTYTRNEQSMSLQIILLTMLQCLSMSDYVVNIVSAGECQLSNSWLRQRSV